MSDSSTTEDRDLERKLKLEEFYFQRRVLFGCTVSLFFAVILWIIAMSTNRWYIVNGGPEGKFVERTRRYFKYSSTGIWSTCRKMYTPEPAAPWVVRNYTKFALISTSHLIKAKTEFREEGIVANFSKVDLPDLDTIDEIDESFRQHLFAEWISFDDKPTAKFNNLKKKIKELKKPRQIIRRDFLNPAEFAEMEKELGGLVTRLDFNGTTRIRIVVPEDLRNLLFEGWEKYGMRFVHLMYTFGRNLGVDANIYKNNVLYIFRPPPKPKNKKFNGFEYIKRKICTFTSLFAHSDEEIIAEDPSMDETLLELSRTGATFTIFTVFLIVLGFIFTVYTFFNPRYMFKRLAGGVHFISGATSLIVCRVMMMMMNHSEENLSSKFPKGSDFEFGYGLFFGIVVSTVNFISAIMFLWYSKKKKGNKAATEELGMADEPINIGR